MLLSNSQMKAIDNINQENGKGWEKYLDYVFNGDVPKSVEWLDTATAKKLVVNYMVKKLTPMVNTINYELIYNDCVQEFIIKVNELYPMTTGDQVLRARTYALNHYLKMIGSHLGTDEDGKRFRWYEQSLQALNEKDQEFIDCLEAPQGATLQANYWWFVESVESLGYYPTPREKEVAFKVLKDELLTKTEQRALQRMRAKVSELEEC